MNSSDKRYKHNSPSEADKTLGTFNFTEHLTDQITKKIIIKNN